MELGHGPRGAESQPRAPAHLAQPEVVAVALEHGAQRLGRDAAAVVAHAQQHPVPVLPQPQLDQRGPGVDQGVGEQVKEQELQELRVGVQVQRVRQLPPEAELGEGVLHRVQHAVAEQGQVQLHRRGRGPVQKEVPHQGHVFRQAHQLEGAGGEGGEILQHALLPQILRRRAQLIRRHAQGHQVAAQAVKEGIVEDDGRLLLLLQEDQPPRLQAVDPQQIGRALQLGTEDEGPGVGGAVLRTEKFRGLPPQAGAQQPLGAGVAVDDPPLLDEQGRLAGQGENMGKL